MSPPNKTFNYGGQAIMEGVMMRGEHDWAACVRAPSGEIVVQRQALPQAVYRSKILKWPFLRGLVMLWDSLGLGLRALLWSADVALDEEEEVHFTGPLAWGTVGVSLVLGIGLFMLLPMLLVSLIDRYIASALWSNLAEGALRLALFTGYLLAIGQMPDIRRVFAYHGAEHKTINAYEAGAPLEPESVARYSRAHVRCGTGFLLIVLLVFVVLATLMGRPPFLLRLLSRVVLIPVVAGISYELLKLSAKYYGRSAVVRALVAPGLLLQRLTTREPDLPMLEVAIAALNQVLESEGLAVAAEPVTVAPAPAPADA
ncbi:MAG: DUF1385 domain-containing protein [Chloroflexi bacterium]|nr:DUF1385 domain-containing protein [Chloroflexota bacterium]